MSSTPDRAGWWFLDGKPTYVLELIDDLTDSMVGFAYETGDLDVDDRPICRRVTKGQNWQGPCTRGTVIEGKRPTREQNEALGKVGGFWVVAINAASGPTSATAHPAKDDSCAVWWGGNNEVNLRIVDGRDAQGQIWRAVASDGSPIELEVAS